MLGIKHYCPGAEDGCWKSSPSFCDIATKCWFWPSEGHRKHLEGERLQITSCSSDEPCAQLYYQHWEEGSPWTSALKRKPMQYQKLPCFTQIGSSRKGVSRQKPPDFLLLWSCLIEGKHCVIIQRMHSKLKWQNYRKELFWTIYFGYMQWTKHIFTLMRF